MSDGNTWSDWEDRIEELDSGAFTVTGKEADFLESLMEHHPQYLTIRQVKWLEDMCKKYGVM